MPTVEVPFEVELNYAGWRLDRYLQQKLTRLSRARIQRLIREKLRSEHGPLKPASPVRPGMRFVLLRETDHEPEPESPWKVGILHDDAHLLVVDKPAGLAVHPSARYLVQTLTRWLDDHALGPDGRRPDLAHRLDRETSGLVACGRGVAATRALKLAFARRDVDKAYLALVEGRVALPQQTIDAPLKLTQRVVNVLMEVSPDGLPSQTEIRVLRRGVFKGDGAGVSLVEARPLTGRQHQIRVHLQSIGHPIVGDKIYAGDPERFLRFCHGALTDADRAALRLPRQALHAFRLELPHPATGARLRLESPLPEDLVRFAEAEIVWDAPAREAAGERAA